MQTVTMTKNQQKLKNRKQLRTGRFNRKKGVGMVEPVIDGCVEN